MERDGNPPFVFFGTPQFAVYALEGIAGKGVLPTAVVTAPDRPAGRGLRLTPPPVKTWAQSRGVPVLQPEKLDEEFFELLSPEQYAVGVVAAYGKILPQSLIDAFPHGILNIHPSLLPAYRGASPLESAILSGDKTTGVTIIQIDAEMDHGPIIGRWKLEVGSLNKEELGEELFRKGGAMVADIIPKWVAGEISAKEQDHTRATYTQKITKDMGLLDLSGDPEENWRKYRAFVGWPGTYFFAERSGKPIRMKITRAEHKDGTFSPTRVIPEGGKEMDYTNA